MPICNTCHKFHAVGEECPQLKVKSNAPASIDHLFKSIDPNDVNPDQEQQPLRARQINKITGKEDNFIENYYSESKRVAQMSRDEVESIRARYEIEVEGERVPNPITSFREAGLSPDIVHHIERLGFVEPTPIQMQSLPCLMSGRDVVGMAETGSGKTLCYILPMLMFLRSKPPTGPGEGPLVIILAPTRELVEQIYSETIKLMPQVAMSVKATSATPVPSLPAFTAPSLAPLPSASPAPPAPSSSVSDFARRIQLQKQQSQVKLQQAAQQQQLQQIQQAQLLELQQLQQQHLFEFSQFTPEQAIAQGIPQQHQSQLSQLAAQHQAQLAQVQVEHAQQQQQLLAEHAQQQLAYQQKQQQKQEKDDFTLYSQAAANGQYDYSNYNYETAAAYYTQHGAEAQEYTYAQDYAYPQYNTPAPVAANTPPPTPRKVLGVCGGVPIQIQISPLQRGVDILVSTPGRLIDLINKGVCKLDRVSYMVFDEADRMLALEMEVQLRHIVTQCSICVRQSVLFSATFPPAVERLVRSAVLNPIYVRVGAGNVAAETITQNVIFMHSGEKRAKLLEVLRETPKPPVLIFANSHHSVDYLVKLLREEQFHAAGLHSDKSQPYRFRVMKAFKDGALDILVATDVASRGIDVSDVTHVIIYDLPDNIEDYIHRIGRTGRAGKNGLATAFLTLDCKIADDLRRLLKQSKQFIPPELQNPKQFGGEIVRGELRDYAVKKRQL